MDIDVGILFKDVQKKGKPPPEPTKRIARTRAFDDITKANASGLRTLILADGAPCYKRLAKANSLLLRQCNHSKGVWCVKIRVGSRGTVSVHTGGIWRH